MKEGIDQMFQKDVFAMCKCDAPIMVVPRKEHVAGVLSSSECLDHDEPDRAPRCTSESGFLLLPYTVCT